MSEDEHDEDIDIDSDMDDENGDCGDGQFSYQVAEKRKHHNALERKRRDHIKESFTSLRDSVPSLQGEKASRAQILKQATDYIQYMSKKTLLIQNDIDNVIQENRDLEKQEKARVTSNFISEHTNYNSPESGLEIDVESVCEPVVFGGSLMPAPSTSKTYSTNPKSLLVKPRQGYIAPSVTTRKRSKLI